MPFPVDFRNNLLVRDLIRLALKEDMAQGDITAQSLKIDSRIKVRAKIVCRQAAVVCGMPIAERVCAAIDHRLKVSRRVKEGVRVEAGQVIGAIDGPAPAVLKAERTVLNFLGRLSGIASQTAIIVSQAGKAGVKILDTRKTTPGLRVLEKYAVKIGGGYNHRLGLSDMVLIKDNHLEILHKRLPEIGISGIIELARHGCPTRRKLEIEVENPADLEQALESKADVVLLDNMSVSMMRRCVRLRDRLRPATKLEASGNINAGNIAAVARSGVDFISMGMLTHSVKNIDFSLEIEEVIKEGK